MSDDFVDIVTVMKSSRVGGTEATNNAVGFYIHLDPGPILIVEPTDAAGEKYSKDILDPLIRDTRVLTGLVAAQKSKDRSNTIRHKRYPGGSLYIVGANTPVSFRQLTIRYLVKDDFDGFPPYVGNEGDPGKLADKRTQTFTMAGRKIINVSKPTVRGVSRIEDEWNNSSQNHFYVPCPHCGHFQVLVFSPDSQFAELTTGYLRFDKDNLTWVHYECANCRKPIDESHKNEMVRQGKWIPSRPEVLTHQGFHISQLYSPWSTWTEIAREFKEAFGQIEKWRTFVNDTLGETFKEGETYEFTGDVLMLRREGYEGVPPGALFLTAGVDTQDDRFEVVIYGWGVNNECWFIDSTRVYGSPDSKNTQARLDAYLFQERRYQDGLRCPLAGVGVDTQGHFAETMYRYVKARQKQKFFALKGAAGFGKKIIHKDTRDRKIRARLIIVGVDTAKQLIYDRLRNEPAPDPTDPVKIVYPPNYIHFNMRADKEFFDQLTSERVLVKRVKGQPTRMWELKANVRNEVLDCTVYNLVAYLLLNANMDVIARKLGEKREHAKKEANPETSTAAQLEAERPPDPKPAAAPRKKRLRFKLKR